MLGHMQTTDERTVTEPPGKKEDSVESRAGNRKTSSTKQYRQEGGRPKLEWTLLSIFKGPNE